MSGQIQGMFDNVTSSFELVAPASCARSASPRASARRFCPTCRRSPTRFPATRLLVLRVGAPYDTPREIVDLLNREVDTALSDAEIKARIAELGAIPLYGNAGEFGGMPTAETERWRKVVELSGMKKE